MTDPEPHLEAVPTPYDGVTFRSRLEAEWAQTLNLNKIAWEYEPETITLPSGATYIPDFWLPQLGTWIEVKGPNVPRIEKAYEHARERASHSSSRWPEGELVLIGREPLRDAGPRRTRHGYANWETAYGPSAYFTTCLSCRASQWIPLSRHLPCRACRFLLHREDVGLHRAVDRRLRFAEPTDGWESIDWSAEE
ncbi:hypothetical protein [Streptomyces sp. NPDC047315]|uniref:hypothetical protein n=1 Tax=Streptomyces sp. NPDC047315 TaxID=3155142 RepID=UPI0033E32F5F